jgi:F0F1-type ATP synthase assembly protein I
MPDDRPPDAREMGKYMALAQVGFEMVVPLIVGLVIDNYAGTGPWLMVAGAVLGFVGGIMHLIALSNRQNAQDRNQEKEEDRPR